MPYLRPKPGLDTKRTWMSRCMRNERYKGKFTAPNQQLAVCLSMQERAGLPSRIEKMEFAKILKDSDASLKAWETRKRTYSAVGQGSDGFAVAASDHQVHAQSGKERVMAAGTVGGKYRTQEEAQAAAFNLNNPKANSKTLGGQIPRTPAQEKRHQKELESDNWHTRTMAQMRDKSNDSLKFIRQDASEAAKAMQSVGNAEKEGRYLDEAHYASMELNARAKFASKTKKADTMGLGLRF